MSADTKFELLGRLPVPESLLLFGTGTEIPRRFRTSRDASIGIGPAGSAPRIGAGARRTATCATSISSCLPSARRSRPRWVAQGTLDVAAMVMQEYAGSFGTLIRATDSNTSRRMTCRASSHAIRGSARAHAGRALRPYAAHSRDGEERLAVEHLLVASRCAPRADRVAMLMLVGGELPGFVRDNPPGATSSATARAARARGVAILPQRRT